MTKANDIKYNIQRMSLREFLILRAFVDEEFVSLSDVIELSSDGDKKDYQKLRFAMVRISRVRSVLGHVDPKIGITNSVKIGGLKGFARVGTSAEFNAALQTLLRMKIEDLNEPSKKYEDMLSDSC
jgi:hypothetical protein